MAGIRSRRRLKRCCFESTLLVADPAGGPWEKIGRLGIGSLIGRRVKTSRAHVVILATSSPCWKLVAGMKFWLIRVQANRSLHHTPKGATKRPNQSLEPTAGR